MRITACLISVLVSTVLSAQPYIDIARFNYSYSPESGLGKKENPLSSQFFNINVTLPITIKSFSENFFVPLIGIDWQINPRDVLFGVLPGSLWFEHKVNQNFFYGGTFRALTNSYRLQTIDPCASGDCSGKNYLRIDDNQ